jgi:hypothetical protein
MKVQSLPKEFIRMQFLAGIIKEYGNQGPVSPEVYILDIINNKIIPSSIIEVQKIPNLIYDMGGGETSYYEEYNIVIVDNMDENEVKENILEGEKKLYIKCNLENFITLPKANKIIASQIVYHLDDIENFALTINNSLKSGGEIEFNSDIVTYNDVKFIKNLKELGFYVYNFKKQNKGGVLYLNKSKPNNLIITPFDIELKKPKEKKPQNLEVIHIKKIQKYINSGFKGDLNLEGTPLKELPSNLTKVGGNLDLGFSQITSLNNLEYVKGYIYIGGRSQIRDLGKLKYVGDGFYSPRAPLITLDNLEYVGGILDLEDTQVEDLGKLKQVGAWMLLHNTPISKKYTKEQIIQKIKISGINQIHF